MNGDTTMTIPGNDPAAQLVLAIRAGDTSTLGWLVEGEPQLARARIAERCGTRTPLHVVTDWPGYFPAARRPSGC